MKFKFALIMMVAAFFMTACSDDDDNEQPQPQNPAQSIAGTYKGYTVAEFKYITTPMITAEEVITLTANADGTANVAFESKQWGKFTMSKATVTLSGDNYAITGSGKTLMGMSAGSEKEYDFTFNGTLSKDKKTASFVFNVPAVMGGLKITYALGDASTGMLVADTYKGYTVAEFKYITTPMITAEEVITMTANEDGTANVAFESKQWGKFTISKATVALSGDNYTITGSGKTLMGMSAGSEKEYDCTFNGTLSKDKKTASFVFNVPAVMGGLKISFALGDAPTSMLIGGTYKGYTVAEFQYTTTPITTADEVITMTANEDGTANVAFESKQWGKFTISKATVTLSGDNYTINGSGKTLMGMNAGSEKEYDCTFNGILSKDKKNASFVFNVPSVMGGLKIAFALGDAPADMLFAGTYKGYTVAEFQYAATSTTTADEVITMTANTDGTIKVVFKSKLWGTFTISKAIATLNDAGTYSITGSGDYEKEYDCTFNGTLSKDKKTASFVFNVPSLMGGLKMTFTLGDAPANILIAKTYIGSLDLSVNGASSGNIEDSKVQIISQQDGKVRILLVGFGVGDMKLENIEIADVPVMDAKDGSYSLEAEINTISGNIPVTGRLNGIIREGKADITFVMKPGAMPMPITAVFRSKSSI